MTILLIFWILSIITICLNLVADPFNDYKFGHYLIASLIAPILVPVLILQKLIS